MPGPAPAGASGGHEHLPAAGEHRQIGGHRQGDIMKVSRRRFLQLATTAAALSGICAIPIALTSHSARSQAARTIKIVVPFPPGGNTDILARLLSEQVRRAQGPAIVIENRPGASTVIGTEAVARATPDGNTLLVTGNSFVVNPHLRKVNYDPLTSFEPICDLAHVPPVIAVNGASPYRTLDDLLGAARARPGDLTLASIGPATASHIAFEMLQRAASVKMTFVPYPGYAPAVNALLGEHVTSVIADFAVLSEHLKAGKLRALATSSRTRVELLPEVPTVAEAGYGAFEVDIWNGLLAPAKTPRETLSQLAGWFSAAMLVPEIRAKLVVQGFNPVGMCGSDFASYLRKQYEDYGRIIREADIKAE
jgi:tripartite-type tricarboxylate transporter receptor subunit TctC